MERMKSKTISRLFIKYNLLLVGFIMLDFICVIFAMNLQKERKILNTTSDAWTIILFVMLLFFEMFILTAHTVRKIKSQLYELKRSVDILNVQNLDITIGHSNILEIEEVLRTLEKMKEELTISMKKQWHMEEDRNTYITALGHDMKTPLTILKGNVELLGETILSEEQKEYQKSMLNGIARIQNYVEVLQQVNQLSEISRLSMEKLNIGMLITSIKNNLTVIAKQKLINFTVNNNDNCWVIGNRVQLERALENILMNAFEYTSGKKEVQLIIVVNKAVNLIIEDSGSGFTEETLQHGREQFFRGEKSRKGDGHYGLGLYIADQIIKQHKGKLLLDHSERLGGAKVTIVVPLV